MKYFAEVLSFVFNPVIFFMFMPFFIVYRLTASGVVATRWEIFSAIFVAIAITIVLVGRKKGKFSDCDISKKEERYEFYALVLFFSAIYIGASIFLRGFIFPMTTIALGICLGIAMFDFFNRFVKASTHIAVASAFATTIVLLYGTVFFFATVWIVPVLAWARIFLCKHTLREVAMGCLFGTGITLLTFFAGKYMYR